MWLPRTHVVQKHMRCIEAMGMSFGFRLNAKKCGVLPIGCEAYITASDGSFLTCKASISYLGSCLDATGAGGPEICRRLGETKRQFDKLARICESQAAFHFAHPTKDPYLPSLCRVKVVVLLAHNVAE